MSNKNLDFVTILQIIPELNAGGAERTTLDIAQAIVKNGWNSIVVSNGGRLVSELQAMNVLHITLPVHSKNPFVMLKNAWHIYKIIHLHDVNIIHARSRAPAWSAFLSCKICKIPFITTYHGIYNSKNILKKLYNSIMIQGTYIIANSNFTALHIEHSYNSVRDKIKIIPRGTDFEILNLNTVNNSDIQSILKIWGVSEFKRVILLPARLTRWKGQLFLIEAISILKNNGKLPEDVICILAGDDQGRVEYVAELNAKILDYNLHNLIIITPHITNMAAAYAASYVVVVPSIEPEAFGRVPVEAQAMQRPLIVSHLGAPCETVISSPEYARTGWHVTPNDAHGLANAIFDVLSLSPDNYREIGLRARAHVLQHYGLDQMKSKTLAIYEEILQKNA